MGALADIKRLYQGDAGTLAYVDSVQPEVACSPQFSFYSEKESLPIRETAGRVCGEFVMCYPARDSDSGPRRADHRGYHRPHSLRPGEGL